MCGEREAIEAAGARLVFIGNGSPEQAAEFRVAHAPGADVYTDPRTESYRTLGTVRGVRATLGPKAALAAVRTLRRGFRQGAVKGDPWQQGAVLVVLPGDRAEYRYLSGHAGDHPPTEEVLAALREVTQSAPG